MNHLPTSFPNCYPIAYIELVNDTAMPSTQLTLPICDNQCHPQSYPHCQSKSGCKPLLVIFAFCYQGCSFRKSRHFVGVLVHLVHSTAIKKLPFCYFACLGVVKVAYFWIG